MKIIIIIIIIIIVVEIGIFNFDWQHSMLESIANVI